MKIHNQTVIKNGQVYIKGSKAGWYYDSPEFWKLFDKIEKDLKIIDVGCGAGIVANELLAQGIKNISLVDIKDRRIFDEIKSLPFYRLDLSYEQLPFDDNSIDIAIATEVAEHLENPWFFIREIRRTLKPGGKIILAMPNPWNIVSRLLFLKKGVMEDYGSNHSTHIWPPPKDIFEMSTQGLNLISKFYGQRRKIYLGKLCLHFNFPKTEFWSNRVCFLFEKIS